MTFTSVLVFIAISIVAVTCFLFLRTFVQKNENENENENENIQFCDTASKEFEDYQRNIMRIYCVDGTKLTIHKGKVTNKTNLKRSRD